MRRWKVVLGSVVAAALPFDAAAAPPVPMPSSGPWAVDFTDDGCTLSRPFGVGAQKVIVGFVPMFTASTIEVIVVGQDDNAAQRRGFATIAEEPDGKPIRGSYFSVADQATKTRITRITVTRDVWNGLSKTETLTIKAFPVSIRAQLVHFAMARAAFDRCEQDTLKAWGVDPATLESRTAAKPIGSIQSYFKSSLYPALAQRKGKLGRVITILTIDASGKVSDCRIGSHSWAELDAASCTQARIIPFEPARDTDGRAVPSIFVLPVNWVFPE